VPFGAPGTGTSRRAFLRALSFLSLSSPAAGAAAQGRGADVFRTGWNHPWIGYGHDFGRAWGHDGLSTSGWTCETAPGTRGFTDSRVVIDPETRRGALRIDAELRGGDPGRSRGAISLSLADHWPFPCPRPAGPLALNLDGVLARCRIRLPKSSAGAAGQPNWLQFFLKTQLSDEGWPSLYLQPVRISPSWEERYIEIVVPLHAGNPTYAETGFDIGNVSLIGLAMGVEPASAAIDGAVWVDEVVLETRRPTVFNFEQPEIGAQFADVQRRTRAWSLVRFFVFCDGRAAPAFAPDGSVAKLDETFYRDFDVLVDTAAQQGLSLIPVLLDYGWCAYPRTVSGVRLGGHAEIIREGEKRQSFLENALGPLLERYGRHPAIYAWDVCNEPEWIVDDFPDAFRQDHDVVSLAEMRAFVRSCAASVHRFAPTQLVTLGSARRKWLSHWTGCDLDLYQFHWYDHLRGEEPFPWNPYDELGLDKPCLIGEVPTRSTRFTRQQFLRAAEEGGYSGLLFWSYGARDPFSNLCPTREEPRHPCRPADSAGPGGSACSGPG
jgi:hypothetical protein